MTPGNRKRLGEFLILLIYLLVEVFAIWPLSHFWCLATTIIGIVALLFLDGEFSENRIGSIAAILIAVCAIIYAVAPPTPPDETETHGWLQPANDEIPQPPCAGISADTVVLYAGGMRYMVPQKEGKVRVIVMGKCDPLTIMKYSNGLAIDSQTYNEQDNLIYRIEGNEFHLVSGEISYAKRPDKSTLAVYDKRGTELLFIRYMGAHDVKVRGTFKCPGYGPATITDEAVSAPGIIGGLRLRGPGCISTPAVIFIQ